ncbi:MAG: urea transporter [Ferruginibacter sp.]
MKPKQIIPTLKSFLLAVLNSYGMLFFSKNKLFSFLILVVSFIVPYTGLTGLIALIVSIVGAHVLGFDKQFIQSGLYTYSPLLFGLGFGTNFESGTAFYVLLVIGALMALLISVMLNARLGIKGLPALSLGFIFSTWVIILASKEFTALGLNHRLIYWYNEAYALGGKQLVNIIQSIENWPLPVYIAGFFRSMSGILFQVNVACGILLSIGLLIYSRIGFVLMVYGYIVALYFNYLMGGYNAGNMTYYNMGTNFMLVAMALGGFYLIASLRSFLWILVTVPLAYLLVVGLGRITFNFGLPVFSLPFCMVVILFLQALQLRTDPKRLMLTPIQFYSPEVNLYRYLNGKERLQNEFYFHLSLPVMGEWMVSQGYEGSMTHKGDWSKAIDFVVLDEEMKTYANPGNLVEHFYAFNKPVLAPADGFVQEVIDHIEDNAIGQNNTTQNWGNTIVIRHNEQLYTKLSHLKKHSIKVQVGAFVKKGDVIAACGNSGRSPEPHLHFQVQSTPYIGSKTVSYPFNYFIERKANQFQLKSFSVPKEGSFVHPIAFNSILQKAFNFQPGYIQTVSAAGFEDEIWEVQANINNHSYLYCAAKNAYAYFVYNGSAFYFTSYVGPKRTLLYYFYLSAYKVMLSADKRITITDNFPLQVLSNGPIRWLQDFVAPFYIFLKVAYTSKIVSDGGMLGDTTTQLESSYAEKFFNQEGKKMNSSIFIEGGQLTGFTIKGNKINIQAICKPENMY